MSFWSRLGLIDKESFLSFQSEIIELRKENQAIAEQNKKNMEEIISLRASGVEGTLRSEIELAKSDIVLLSKRITELCGVIAKLESLICDEFDFSNNAIDAKIKQVLEELTDKNQSVVRVQEKVLRDAIERITQNVTVIESKVEEYNEINLYRSAQDRVFVIQEISQHSSSVKEILESIQRSLDKANTNDADNGLMIKASVEKLTALMEKTNRISEKSEEIDQVGSDIKVLSESLSNLWTIMKAIWIDSVLSEINESVD
jgi:uncharacterized protein YoxC